ncbi:MAG: EamA family transporter [Elusimicrobiaceae bacterium]|nr:EamA family transporter [Elusimicrobiaceae bacterium]
MIVNLLLLLGMTGTGAFASLCLKRAVKPVLWHTFFSVGFYAGGILYLLAALLNIWALRRMEYSVVLPLTSVTYIWTLVLASIFLKEKITKDMIRGIIYIIIGAVVLSISI